MRQIHLRSVFSMALIAAFLVLGAIPADAYYSTMDTGDILAPGTYRAILEPQLIVNKYDGFNIVGRFDTGIFDDANVRAVIGFGKVDFQTGAFYKWVPFPDADQQPALGGEAGILFARVNGANEVSLRFHPLISKKFATDAGDFTPYASLPIGITTRSDETYVPVQIAAGTEWKTLNFESLHFMMEIGINLNRSFSYISGGLVYYFDESSVHSSGRSSKK